MVILVSNNYVLIPARGDEKLKTVESSVYVFSSNLISNIDKMSLLEEEDILSTLQK